MSQQNNIHNKLFNCSFTYPVNGSASLQHPSNSSFLDRQLIRYHCTLVRRRSLSAVSTNSLQESISPLVRYFQFTYCLLTLIFQKHQSYMSKHYYLLLSLLLSMENLQNQRHSEKKNS